MSSKLTKQGVLNLSPRRNGHRPGKVKLWGVCDHDWQWHYDEYGGEWQECRRCGRRPEWR